MTGTDNTRLPKHALKDKPLGIRDRGRPKKRWQCVDAGTCQRAQSMAEDDDDENYVFVHSRNVYLYIKKAA